ncbi:phosphatidylinositol 4-kinase Lsb6p [[Candida] jaroonii]|uniref:Phosphatidylinositol 4-kinase Lsb6p n=1 Tax=[Candida] jaroonii TaxID=467808 RepID=A0ACA9Y1P6_9ASCO|nr:phosphatidylinositol 4-kinase Lsb6p [[Candida] jaroonii]
MHEVPRLTQSVPNSPIESPVGTPDSYKSPILSRSFHQDLQSIYEDDIFEGGLKPPRKNSSNSIIRKVKKWIAKKPKVDPYKIEYSILSNNNFDEPIPVIPFKENHYSLSDFNKLINQILRSIDKFPPQRISKGSSGSYFVYMEDVNPFEPVIIGVFKPKSEEPYGPLSPKWQKWIHRTFFPWFFGRGCLLSNQGYISEASASYIDQMLLSFIVPYTDIIYLKSSSFYYGFWTRISSHPITWKIGSFQVFLNGYIGADEWFKVYPLSDFDYLEDDYVSNEKDFKWSKRNLIQFQEELEKLVILDYLIRNTDRGLDNWMIKCEWVADGGSFRPFLKIGAIDSGLAFPWKHPNEWRSFPYGWLFLPSSLVGQPFSNPTRLHYQKLLTSKNWWENTITGWKKISQKDSNFSEKYFRRQVSIMKGQAFNIIKIFNSNGSPMDLSKCQPVVIWDDFIDVPEVNEETDLLRTKKGIVERMELIEGKPFFSGC